MSIFKNWTTTLAGLGAILTALTTGDISAIGHDLPAIIAGVGLILAKDAGK
jgi:hypothetical protein